MGIHKFQTKATGLMALTDRPFNELVKPGRRTGISVQKIEYFTGGGHRPAIHLGASPAVFTENNPGTGRFRDLRGIIGTPSIRYNDFIRGSPDQGMEKIDQFPDLPCFIKSRYDNTESRNRFCF